MRSFNSKRCRARTGLRIAALYVALVQIGAACPDAVGPGGRGVASVEVTPATANLLVGKDSLLLAVVRDSAGTVIIPSALSGPLVAWSSSDSTLVRVTAAGLITAAAAGTAWVVATGGDASDTAVVTVLDESGSPPPGSEPPPPGSEPPPPESEPPPPGSEPPPAGPLPVVPGLQGFGVSTPAGRGGAILRVTNLNDAGAGSLRAAVTATGPRTIIFEVSGTIQLAAHLRINEPYVTIAGQTAPSPGITLKGAGFDVRTHDVLIQHLRIRVGDGATGPSPDARDGFMINGPNARNVVLDHLSVSWGIDENGSTWYTPLSDVTINQSIISEALSNSLHSEGEHSKGILVGDGTKRHAVIGSLLAHNRDRNTYNKGGTTALFANNVVYNWGGSKATHFADPDGSGAQSGSVVGNLYVRGANSTAGPPIRIYSSVKTGSSIYVADNSDDRAPPPSDPWTLVRNDFVSSVRASAPPVWIDGFTARPVGTVEAWVLANAGARPADRDAVDVRIVQEVTARTGQIIDSPGQVGGWPTLGQNIRSLTTPSDPHGDADGDGYTNLEEWLHQHSAVVEGRP